MKKHKEKTASEEKPTQQLKEYFTKEINDSISEMTYQGMTELLEELEGLPHWIAILKYTRERLLYSQQALYSIDPFKDPTSLARTQGISLGLSDLQDMVIRLKTPPETEEGEE